jgi:hypothetical protein
MAESGLLYLTFYLRLLLYNYSSVEINIFIYFKIHAKALISIDFDLHSGGKINTNEGVVFKREQYYLNLFLPSLNVN